MSEGTYYLGRVIKTGSLDQAKLLAAIQDPVSLTHKQFDWNIIDTQIFNENTEDCFVFGKLAKVSLTGTVPVLDRELQKQVEIEESDLIKDSAPFVYIPKYSGIAFLHIWNSVQKEVFIKRFQSIIEKKYGTLVGCEIELISDLETFLHTIKGLEGVEEIRAKVHPPNPLFGHLWESLKKYLEKRNASELTINEKNKSRSLVTDIVKLVTAVVDEKNITSIDGNSIDISDAALLMAVDGYGKGRIRGMRNSEVVIIKTNETAVSFVFDKSPEPEELYRKASSVLEEISKKRHMGH